MTTIAQGGGATLATYAYDGLGRRDGLSRDGGAATDFSYDLASRLTGLAHDLSGTSHDQALALAYSPASQLTGRTRSNAAYDWIGVSSARSYARNGLNQYVTVGGVSVTHDARGNMTADGAKTYAFDYDNRLVSASGGVALAYDPGSRLSSIAQGASTTRFLYDGPALIAEVDGAGTVLRRYVHGPGVDEPIVWYEGSGTSDRRFLASDERGSIVAVASSGAVTVNRYDEYGIPAATNTGRFQYTGQLWLTELALYHYKARAYHPTLGRFLQTDPIRYGDGMNLYAYANNDPLNLLDPMGTQACPPDMANCYEADNYDPAKVIDDRTITQPQSTSDAMNMAAPLYETHGQNEDVLEFEAESGFRYVDPDTEITTVVQGVFETEFSPTGLPTDALLHLHPNDQSTAAIGPGDDAAVIALGVTNNVGNNGDVGHLGMVDGQFFYQMTQGTLSSAERLETRQNLREMQRRNQH